MKPDIIVIGSGPAGVSVAHALLETGLKVLMVDNDIENEIVYSNIEKTIWEFRSNEKDQSSIKINGDPKYSFKYSTPKMKVPAFQQVYAGFKSEYGISTHEVYVTGSACSGGLSRMWGAGVPTLLTKDLSSWPINQQELNYSYSRIAKRIGISGIDDTNFYGDALKANNLLPPVELTPPLSNLFSSYKKKEGSFANFSIARSRNAVLTKDYGSLPACVSCGRCLFGCPSNSIYDARHDLANLKKHANFSYLTGITVSDLSKSPDNFYNIIGRKRNTIEPNANIVRARFIVLAAGAIGSTILTARYLQEFNKPINIKSHPAFAMGFLSPAWLGKKLPSKFFSLAALSFSVKSIEKNEIAFGSIFPGYSIPAGELTERIPLSRPTAAQISRYLQPALILANCYLPSDHANIFLKVTSNKVDIFGSYADSFSTEFRNLKQLLTHSFRQLGVYSIPMSSKIAQLGSDGHFVGSLPMTLKTDIWGCSFDGEVNGSPGLFVVDGAALPNTGVRNPTFTIMANADRIGLQISKKYQLLHSKTKITNERSK